MFLGQESSFKVICFKGRSFRSLKVHLLDQFCLQHSNQMKNLKLNFKTVKNNQRSTEQRQQLFHIIIMTILYHIIMAPLQVFSSKFSKHFQNCQVLQMQTSIFLRKNTVFGTEFLSEKMSLSSMQFNLFTLHPTPTPPRQNNLTVC